MKEVIKMVFGSKLYGTDTPLSDTDYKGIFIPSAKDILLGTSPKSINNSTGTDFTKNTEVDIDDEMYSLKNFIDMGIKGETIVIDMIHANDDNIVYRDKSSGYVWDYIKLNRNRFYTTDMKAYLGYVRKQAGKYGVKGTRLATLRQVKNVSDNLLDQYANMNNLNYPHNRIQYISKELPVNDFAQWVTDDKGNCYYEVLGRKYQSTMKIAEFKQKINGVWAEYGERARKAEANEGIDWKAMHHACRGGMQLLEIYKNNDLKYPLAEKELLKQIKDGKLPFNEVQELLEYTVDEVERYCKQASSNGMPSKVDTKFWYDFVENVYYNQVIKV